MTDQNQGISVGPNVDAILSADPGAPMPYDGGMLEITPESPAAAEPAAELLAGKFKSVDDLAKAYKELESKLGAPKDAAKQEETPAEDSAPAKMGDKAEDKAEETPAEDAPAEAALDIASMSAEYAENGTISDDSYAALEKAGISREFVDTYVQGLEAIQQVRQSQLFETAGGKAEYEALVKWGSQNLPEAQRNAFDNAVDAAILEGDLTAVTMLVQGVRSQMAGSEPNLLQTTNSSSSNPNGVQPFANQSAMMEAMRDPRYRSDPMYVAEVQARLAISDVL